MSRKDFNYTLDKSTDESEGEEDAQDGTVPNFGKFESKKAKILKKNLLGEGRFKEPRMFTMEQIRNIVFGVVNQSTLNDRVSLTEQRFVKIHNTCLRLDEIDKQIRHEGQQMNSEITERVNKWKEEFANLQRHNEKVMQEHKMRLSSNAETIVKHREMLDENKHMLNANQDLINKIGSKLERAKDNLSNEMTMTREELQ